MSFRKGRGGKNNNTMLTNLPFGLGYQDVANTLLEENPQLHFPVNGLITPKERSLAIKYIKFAQAVRDGPFFTGSIDWSIESQEKGNHGKKRKVASVDEDENDDGIERYSDKYANKRRIGTSISEYPYDISQFPEELYKLMTQNKNRNLKLTKSNNTDDIFTGSKDDDSKGLSILEKLKELAEDANDDDADENANNEGDDENAGDDDFDDESEDDDYNAEKYFDDGDDYGNEEDYGDDEPAF